MWLFVGFPSDEYCGASQRIMSWILSSRVHERTQCGYHSTQVPPNRFRAFFGSGPVSRATLFFLFLFLVRFARCRLPSSVRRSVEVTVVPFASGAESGRLCSVPESKNIHKLCRQLGNLLVTLSLSQSSARQKLRRSTSDTVFHFIQVTAAARVSDPRFSTERHQMMSETTVTKR